MAVDWFTLDFPFKTYTEGNMLPWLPVWGGSPSPPAPLQSAARPRQSSPAPPSAPGLHLAGLGCGEPVSKPISPTSFSVVQSGAISSLDWTPHPSLLPAMYLTTEASTLILLEAVPCSRWFFGKRGSLSPITQTVLGGRTGSPERWVAWEVWEPNKKKHPHYDFFFPRTKAQNSLA